MKFWNMVLQERTRVIVKLSQQLAIFPSEITRTSGLVGDVQCSQEDGRTGVFISVDALLLENEKQREVNIFSFVRNMFKDSMAWSKQFDSIDSFTKRSWRRIHKVNFIGKDCYSNQHCWCTCTCTMYACSLNSSVKYCFNEFCWVFLNVFF